jgi:glycerol 2-dehydrogenase (NADP+)
MTSPTDSTMAQASYPSAPAGTTSIKLNTGASCPSVGLGTWQSKPGQVEGAVEIALKNGYRHIDGAWIYGNEKEVGEGIRRSGLKREDIFVTTKLWGIFHRRVEEALDASLKDLGLDYVDLYLMHWPVPLEYRGPNEKIPLREDGSRAIDTDRKLSETWADLEKVYKSGKAKAIGVSNVSEEYMKKLLKTAEVVPAANQVELHPYLPQHELVKFCQSKGIAVQAYSPLGSTNSPLLQDPVIVEIAEARGVDVGQVAISWQAQRGVIVLPKSVTESRIISNAKLLRLSDEEMHKINELYLEDGKQQRFIKPKVSLDIFAFEILRLILSPSFFHTVGSRSQIRSLAINDVNEAADDMNSSIFQSLPLQSCKACFQICQSRLF